MYVGQANLPSRPVPVKLGEGHELCAMDRAFIPVGELHNDFSGASAPRSMNLRTVTRSPASCAWSPTRQVGIG